VITRRYERAKSNGNSDLTYAERRARKKETKRKDVTDRVREREYLRGFCLLLFLFLRKLFGSRFRSPEEAEVRNRKDRRGNTESVLLYTFSAT
jgi:hypothetical protein